ncbi:MAG: hypothetical protein JOZ69_25370, partial [Myxococcales bacterium]|nr:hypothetical protein [Myxococcales bacterium]
MKPIPAPLLLFAAGLVVAAIAFLLVRGRADFRRRETARGVLQSIGAGLGALFVGFAFWTQRLPALRGSAWTVRDAAVRSGA